MQTGFLGMGESHKAHHLRQLMRTAQQLRGSAETTTDPHYIGLFLRAAAAVEHRATEIANSLDDTVIADHAVSFDEALAAAPRHVDFMV